MITLQRFSTLLLLMFCSVFLTHNAYAEYEEIEWVELIPADDLAALLDPPSWLDDIEDGSFEDQISNQILGALEMSGDSRYQQALSSTQVVEAYDNRQIRLPGFAVPVEMNDKQQVTEFFLVPYFGACIHYPPPPPNQIIYVHVPGGITIDSIYEPYWVEGRLRTSLVENEIAVSAYSLFADQVYLYTE